MEANSDYRLDKAFDQLIIDAELQWRKTKQLYLSYPSVFGPSYVSAFMIYKNIYDYDKMHPQEIINYPERHQISWNQFVDRFHQICQKVNNESRQVMRDEV